MSDPHNPGDPQRGDPNANPWSGGYQQQPPPYGQQPVYGQAPAGPPQYGQPGQPPQGPYTGPSQPQYPQQPYPQQPYGHPPAGQQPYDQPAYGQQPTGQPQSGPLAYGQQPHYGQPTEAPVQPPGQDQFSSMNRPARGRKPVQLAVLGGIVAVVVIVLTITAFVVPGFAVSKELNSSAVQDGVKSILQKDYQASDVSGVSCPGGQKVEKGKTFDCTATVAGAQQKVTITLLDDSGRYEVGRPTAN